MKSMLKGKGRCVGFGLGLIAGAMGWLATEGSALARADNPASTPTAAAQPAPPAPPSPKKKLGPPPDKKTSAKVNAYIELLNEESEPMFSERDRWYKAIDPKAGPTCKESNISIPNTIGPDGGRYEAYRQKLKAKPALPPDAAALRMVDASEELRNIGKRPGPHSEYQARGKPGEWCKQLKETFPLMVAIFDKYAEGNREVRTYVDNFTDERDRRELETTLKKYGKHYRYQFAAMVLEGKAMMRGVRAELGQGQPDVAAVRQFFANYLALADETKAMMDKEPPKQKTEPYPDTFRFFLVESLPKVKRASEELLTTMAQKPDKKQQERLDSQWDRVVTTYNEVIGYMNQIHFENKQK
jgi:hypothetical protein